MAAGQGDPIVVPSTGQSVADFTTALFEPPLVDLRFTDSRFYHLYPVTSLSSSRVIDFYYPGSPSGQMIDLKHSFIDMTVLMTTSEGKLPAPDTHLAPEINAVSSAFSNLEVTKANAN